ncbi:putative methyltransferase-domain-containing protein [Entophlyctis helioformis]|nr:putative methyltransferase-domain-containing protein [Entophlyctis helioformis]
MGKRRQLPKPVTQLTAARGVSKAAATKTKTTLPADKIHSLQHTQRLISSYHTLNKELDKAAKAGNAADMARIQAELDAMGGLQAYQRASLKGGDGSKGWGATCKWILPHLRKEADAKNAASAPEAIAALNADASADTPTETDGGSRHSNKAIKAPKADRVRLRMLDVGAITGDTYTKHSSFLNVTSIDLNSQSPKVLRQDFFERPRPATQNDLFDVVCLSLVVNFVGDTAARGTMISRTRQFLVAKGLVYIVLPLPCITNSRYMTHELFVDMLDSLDFDLVEHHHARKLAYYLFRWRSQTSLIESAAKSRTGGLTVPKAFPKKVIRNGGGLNNFCILLSP